MLESCFPILSLEQHNIVIGITHQARIRLAIVCHAGSEPVYSAYSSYSTQRRELPFNELRFATNEGVSSSGKLHTNLGRLPTHSPARSFDFFSSNSPSLSPRSIRGPRSSI